MFVCPTVWFQNFAFLDVAICDLIIVSDVAKLICIIMYMYYYVYVISFIFVNHSLGLEILNIKQGQLYQ